MASFLVKQGYRAFALRGAITARGEEVTTKTRTKTEVDRDESRTRTETRSKADGDHDRVGHADVVVYNLAPRAGVNLAAHVGQQVQVTAIKLDRGEDDVRELLFVLAIDAELEHLGAGAVRPELDSQLAGNSVVLAPERHPLFEELSRYLGLHQVLMLGRALAHRLGRRRAA